MIECYFFFISKINYDVHFPYKVQFSMLADSAYRYLNFHILLGFFLTNLSSITTEQTTVHNHKMCYNFTVWPYAAMQTCPTA